MKENYIEEDEVIDSDNWRTIAGLTISSAFKGSFSLIAGMPEVDTYISLLEYANSKYPHHMSIVQNSILSALNGNTEIIMPLLELLDQYLILDRLCVNTGVLTFQRLLKDYFTKI